MNYKSRSTTTYIVIAIILIMIIGSYSVIDRRKTTSEILLEDINNDILNPVPILTVNVTPNVTPNITPNVIPMTRSDTTETETVKCELCHKKSQEIKQHLEGGKFCIDCHGGSVHNIHVGLGTIDIGCNSCHGFPPDLPVMLQGTGPGSYSICESCHAAPPNSYKPSFGNLVSIHFSRGKHCVHCHGTDIGATHFMTSIKK